MLACRMYMAGCVLMALLVLAGCSVRDNAAVPTETPDNVFVIVTSTPGTLTPPTPRASQNGSYVVQEGDNLSDIAGQFDVTLIALQEANGIENPDNIFVGQRLIIPTPGP